MVLIGTISKLPVFIPGLLYRPPVLRIRDRSLAISMASVSWIGKTRQEMLAKYFTSIMARMLAALFRLSWVSVMTTELVTLS